jgi:hypothetical protein
MHEDIALPVCDACVDESRTQERANDAMRAVPLDVEPDEVVSGLLFIGKGECGELSDAGKARNFSRAHLLRLAESVPRAIGIPPLSPPADC